jgi:hypothetical protein
MPGIEYYMHDRFDISMKRYGNDHPRISRYTPEGHGDL